MTDHASLLKQIRADARPYVEQALDLAEVFTGFRKLASENGLDWGVIKQLIKAELQDEKEGGDEKVSRIIEKADFASAYADMLGLRGGDEKMNENNFSSAQAGVAAARSASVASGGGDATGLKPASPPSFSDETAPVSGEAEGAPVRPVASSASPIIPDEAALASGDAGEIETAETSRGRPADITPLDASPISSMPDMPDFLKRSAA